MRLGGLDWRTVRSAFVLSLPTLVVVGVGCYFLASQVPSIVKNEQLRVRSVYRQSADELRTSPETGFPVIRGKGQFWTKDMKLRPGYWGTVPAGSEFKTLGTVPKTLGTVPEKAGTVPGETGKNTGTVPDGMMLVWYEGSKGNCIAKFVKSEKEYDYLRIFWLGVPLFLFVLCGMTFIGIRYFVEYIKARDDFLAATAHDLTTPLVGMRMSIGRSDADAKALTERLIRIVENIKDFMRLGGKRREPEISEFDIIKAYDEAYALFREDYRDLFDGKDVPVEVTGTVPETVGTVPQKAGTVPEKTGTVPGGWGLKVRADETMTVQMLWNLLGNDLKYAAPYGSVRVRFFVEGKFVKAEFVDEGQGMTPRQMRRAFDRYYRAKTVLESGKGGFGIGLCTAREFARAMDGDISVRANSPHGCIFTLSLPAANVS